MSHTTHDPRADELDGTDDDGTIELPEYYRREIAEREAMARECPIDVYYSSQNPRAAWPFKLNRAGKQSPATAKSCATMLVDAGYANLTDTPEIAMTAHRTDADLVIARDLTSHHPAVGDNRDRHEDSITLAFHTALWLDELRGTSDVSVGKWPVSHDATVMLPLQPPYGEQLDWLDEPHESGNAAEPVRALDRFNHFAVGGLQDLDTPRERIQALDTVREYVGDDAYVHALAPGTEPRMLHALRQRPDLVDSLDVSTPENAPANNKLPDKFGKQHKHLLPTGTDISTVRAGYAAAVVMQLAFLLTPSKCDDEMFGDMATAQSGIGQWTN